MDTCPEPIGARTLTPWERNPFTMEWVEETPASNQALIPSSLAPPPASPAAAPISLPEAIAAWKKAMGIEKWSVRVLITDPEHDTEWELMS